MNAALPLQAPLLEPGLRRLPSGLERYRVHSGGATVVELHIGDQIEIIDTEGREDDFIGKAALQKRKASPQKQLVGLELAGDEAPSHGNCVRVSRLQVGEITSATRSPILRKTIALCRIAVEYAEIGQEVEIGQLDGHQKCLPARVVPFPFYDPEKTRVRA